VNKVFEIRKKENKLYYGGIDYYLLKRKEIKNKLEQVVIKEIKLSNRKDQKREEAELRQQKYKATRDIIAGIKSYEEKIEQLENLKDQLELDLTKNEIYSNSQLIKEKTAQYELTKKELETTYLKWSELNEKLERIEQSLK
jgi:ATP-binding cassette subfamily F protein 3